MATTRPSNKGKSKQLDKLSPVDNSQQRPSTAPTLKANPSSPTISPRKNMPAQAYKAIIKNADMSSQALGRPLLLISVGGEKHEKEFLSETLNLLRYYGEHKLIQDHLDVLVAGTLQRHNFWLFCHTITDADLEAFLSNISDDIGAAELALKIAALMYEAAEQAETKYIKDTGPSYFKLSPTVPFRVYRWSDFVPMSVPIDESYRNYFKHRASLDKKLAADNDGKFSKAIDETAFEHIDKAAKLDPIKRESRRLAAAAINVNKPKLAAIFSADNGVTFAKICSRNYLLEECPLLFPQLTEKGYTSIVYPGPITAALKAVKKAFECSLEWLNIYHEKVDPKKSVQTIRDLGSYTKKVDTSASLFSRRNSSQSAPLKTLSKTGRADSSSPKSEPIRGRLSTSRPDSDNDLKQHARSQTVTLTTEVSKAFSASVQPLLPTDLPQAIVGESLTRSEDKEFVSIPRRFPRVSIDANRDSKLGWLVPQCSPLSGTQRQLTISVTKDSSSNSMDALKGDNDFHLAVTAKDEGPASGISRLNSPQTAHSPQQTSGNPSVSVIELPASPSGVNNHHTYSDSDSDSDSDNDDLHPDTKSHKVSSYPTEDKPQPSPPIPIVQRTVSNPDVQKLVNISHSAPSSTSLPAEYFGTPVLSSVNAFRLMKPCRTASQLALDCKDGEEDKYVPAYPTYSN